jgi:hypothetical protein
MRRVFGLRLSARGASFKTIETEETEYPLIRATSMRVTDLEVRSVNGQHNSIDFSSAYTFFFFAS